MVDMKVDSTETDPAASSLENDNTVKDDGGAVEKPILADDTTKSEGQIVGAVDQVASKGEAETEAAGKSDGAGEGDKSVNEEGKKENAVTLDGLNKNPAVNGKSGADSHDPDTGDRRSGYKRGGHQGGKKFEDYRKNVKTDFTAQKESKDPVEIRKQVIHGLISIRYMSANNNWPRWNFTSLMLIWRRTNSFWRRSAVAPTTLFPSQ